MKPILSLKSTQIIFVRICTTQMRHS